MWQEIIRIKEVPRIMVGSFMRMFKLPKMMLGAVVNRKTVSQIWKTIRERGVDTVRGVHN